MAAEHQEAREEAVVDRALGIHRPHAAAGERHAVPATLADHVGKVDGDVRPTLSVFNDGALEADGARLFGEFECNALAGRRHGEGRVEGAHAKLLLGVFDRTYVVAHAVSGLKDDRQVEADAREAVRLLLLDGDRHGGAEHHQVVGDPAEVDDKRHVLRIRIEEGLLKADEQSDGVERDERDEGPGDVPVEVLLADRAALGRHVELAVMREDERDRGRDEDVPGEDGLVHAAEERIAVALLQDRVRHGRVHHVRDHVGEDGGRRRVDHVDVRIHVGKRGQKEDDARQAVQEMQHRVEETQALRKRQALAEHRIVESEDLDHAARPANALADVGRKGLRGEARSKRTRDEGRVPAPAVELERRVGVFGHGLDRNAADLLESLAAHDGA